MDNNLFNCANDIGCRCPCSWSIKPISQNVSVWNSMKNITHTHTRHDDTTRISQKWKRNTIHSHQPQPTTEKKSPTDIKINQFLKTNEGNNNSEKRRKNIKSKRAPTKKKKKKMWNIFIEMRMYGLNRTNVEREWIERMNRKNCFWWLWQKFSARRFFVTTHNTLHTAQHRPYTYTYTSICAHKFSHKT